MPTWILTTWDAGQYVWVMAPVMHAQQIHAGARVCVSPSPPPQCTIERFCATWRVAQVSALPLRSLDWPDSTAADQQPLAGHLHHQTGSHSRPQCLRTTRGGMEDHSKQWLWLIGHYEMDSQL